MFKKVSAALLAAVVAGSALAVANAAESTGKGALDFTIDSPYKNVNWETFGQYKADFHAHSNESDGSPQPFETVEEHYRKGYDVLALTDHNVTNTTWNRKDDPTGKGRTYLTDERYNEITNGTDRGGRGMVAIKNSDEQSQSDHLNTFFTPFNNEAGATLESNIAKCQELGGICHINHPGRYTGGKNTSGTAGEDASNNPATIQKYVDLFMKYDSCVGMEIINKLDGDSYSDRILWDNILEETMEEGRFVWGFSNDDTHSNAATGHSYNMMLMPENTATNVRAAMESGAFYASAKVAKREGYTNTNIDEINSYQPPVITNISVDDAEDTITIEGNYYNTVEWIADGEIIATGNTIDLNDYEGKINSYVRAQLKGNEGISFTQPFGVKSDIAGKANLSVDKNTVVVENDNKTVTCTVSVTNVLGANAFDAKLSYDSDVFEVEEVKALTEDTVISSDKSKDGTARMIIGTQTPVNGAADVMQVVLKVKEDAKTGITNLSLDSLNTTVSVTSDIFEGLLTVADGAKDIEVISYRELSDVNNDGEVTLKDLSLAIKNYRTENAVYDIDRSGVVDTADLIIIASYIA